MAFWLEHRTLIRENPGSNPHAAVSKLGQFRLCPVASVYLYNGYRQWWIYEGIYSMTKYLAV